MTIFTNQKYQGLGEIQKGDQVLAKVEYELDEYQERINAEEIGNRLSLNQLGEMRVRGTIVAVDTDEDLKIQ